jgi:hypothetical protein
MTEPDNAADSVQAAPTQETGETPAPAKAVRRPRPSFDWRGFVRENVRMLIVVALLASGVVFVMLGWYGAAHTNIITEQIPYLISGGLLGLGLILVAGMLAMSARQERETELLRKELGRALRDIRAMPAGEPVSAEGASPNGSQVFVLPGGRSYHAASCPLLEGKDGARAMTPAQAVSSAYASCKLCEPG